MKQKLKTVLRVGAFWLVFLALFLVLNLFFQPYWVGGFYNNFETFYGFYEEPENTVESIFVGPSIGINGITPTELYRDFGYCAYNLSGEQQPVLASYYWIEEAYRLHPETLKVVFMEVSGTRVDNDDAFYHKSLDGMRLGAPKLSAVFDYADGSVSTAANYLFPLINYHSRWTEIDAADWNKFSLDPINGTRGYGLVSNVRTESKPVEEFAPKSTVLLEDAEPVELNPRALEYLDKMVSFCKEKGIKLVFFKTPSANWYSKHHNAVAPYAEENGIEFLDFNFGTLAEECGYLAAFDSQDGNHMNYYGAAKVTRWFGDYITENKLLADVRGNEKYAYLEEHLARYDANVTQKMELLGASSIGEYVSFAASRDGAVLLSVKEDAATALSLEERDALAKLGLKDFATLSVGDCYCALIENGTVVEEAILRAGKGESVLLDGTLQNGKAYKIYSSQTKSSIVVGEGEFSSDSRGINVAVYSYSKDSVVANRAFDTHAASRDDRYNRTLAFAVLDDALVGQAENNAVWKDVLYYRDALAAENAKKA
ncbi:MAG: hypothetical protein II328_02480 [Clostridia bacterium]|nr:hypothetical protein [Clostridia bacterium]